MEPVLRIIPRTQIVPILESSPDRIDYLEIAFSEAGYIFNPLLVAEVAENKYLLTEDGSVLEALARLDVDFVPVQVESTSGKSAMAGYIMVQEWTDAYFREFQGLFPRDTSLLVTDGGIRTDDVFACSIQVNKAGGGIGFCHKCRQHVSPILIDFIEYLRRRRVMQKRVAPPFRGYPVALNMETTMIKIGNLKFTDAIWLGQNGFRLPPGFYHPDGICRVLGINYPIKVLKEKASIDDKQSFLHELIALRLESGRAESFSGGVFLLNY